MRFYEQQNETIDIIAGMSDFEKNKDYFNRQVEFLRHLNSIVLAKNTQSAKQQDDEEGKSSGQN